MTDHVAAPAERRSKSTKKSTDTGTRLVAVSIHYTRKQHFPYPDLNVHQ